MQIFKILIAPSFKNFHYSRVFSTYIIIVSLVFFFLSCTHNKLKNCVILGITSETKEPALFGSDEDSEEDIFNTLMTKKLSLTKASNVRRLILSI